MFRKIYKNQCQSIFYKEMITVKIQQFQKVFGNICQEKRQCIMLFTSEQDETGKYWCPSCEKIVPFYEDIEKRAKKAGMSIYRFLVGDKEDWDENHVFQTNKQVNLGSIPTIGIFNGEKLRMEMNGDEIVEQKQRDLFFEFVSKQ